MRTALLLSVTLLALSLFIRATGRNAPPVIGAAGAVLMLGFFATGIVKHYRGLYRMRRAQPREWRPDLRFTAGMVMAPFGGGDPDARVYDLAVRWATAVAAVALVVLLVVVRVVGR